MDNIDINKVFRPSIEDQHLYIMQNEHGFIKVGRSENPEKRRRSLEIHERCKISIVGIFSSEAILKRKSIFPSGRTGWPGNGIGGASFQRPLSLKQLLRMKH